MGVLEVAGVDLRSCQRYRCSQHRLTYIKLSEDITLKSTILILYTYHLRDIMMTPGPEQAHIESHPTEHAWLYLSV
jgi:hypothetical protein